MYFGWFAAVFIWPGFRKTVLGTKRVSGFEKNSLSTALKLG